MKAGLVGALPVALACLALAGLAAVVRAQPDAPVPAEKTAPVTVETLAIEPTVVKTGDRIRQLYRVRFPDLIGEGREVVILEDRMAPENLPVHPFEGVALAIRKRRVEDEHVWDFAYEFRLIAPEKAVYQLPGFSFFYLVRDLGQAIEDAEVEQVDGGGGLVRYVSTMTDLPVLDIRDTIEFGSFQGRTLFFQVMAWGLAPLPLALWLVLLVRRLRRPVQAAADDRRAADELARIEAQIPLQPTVRQARRRLMREIGALAALRPGVDDASAAGVHRGLVIALREYLRAALPALHSGDTARDIYAYVDGLPAGGRTDALRALAARLVACQRGLEHDLPASLDDPAGEARRLRGAVVQLRPHNRLLQAARGLIGA